MRLILIAALFLAFALPVHARLGETEAQCTVRYGQGSVIEDGTKSGQLRTIMFRKSGIHIDIEFLNGIAAEISFEKDTGDFSNDQIQALLDDNSQGLKWKSSNFHVEGDAAWDRSDGAWAQHSPDGRVLTITSKAMMDRDTQTADPPTTNTLQGF
jgi:hypothetical protein